ncbi:MAG: dihydropteroate synthase, partial [Chloroflexota bacterium]
VVVMHIQGEPRVPNPHPAYENVVDDVLRSLDQRVALCLRDGIAADRIIIDPGPGFGKTTAHDLAILNQLERFTAAPYPVLLAASRKQFIGDVLHAPPGQRLEGSLAAVAWGVLHGVKLVRVHDVRASRRVVLMTEAVCNPERQPGFLP